MKTKAVLRLAFLALLVAGASSSIGLRPAPPGLVRPAGGVVALVGGRVITGTGSGDWAARSDCTVLIEDERITAVGSDVEVPEGATVVDVSGHSIVPGMIDMHGHLYGNVGGRIASLLRPFARLYLAGGVTTVFSPGDFDPEATVAFRDEQAVGEEVGTRIFTAGPYFTHATPGSGWMKGVTDADGARAQFRAWKGRIDGVKVYTEITEEEFAAVVEEADELGLRVTGHLESLTAGRAIELGIDGLEHGIFAMSEFGRMGAAVFDLDYMQRLAAIDFEEGPASELVDEIVAAQVVVDPTIVIFEALYQGPLVLEEDWERYLSPQVAQVLRMQQDALDKMKEQAVDDHEAWEKAVAGAMDKQRELVRRVHERGGLVTAGTDPVFIEVVPGHGMHREAAHFVKAGLTELDALRACTLTAAEAIGLGDDLGTIEPGKLADLVVVEGDPSKDINDLRNTKLVFQAGAQFSPEDLRESVVGTIE